MFLTMAVVRVTSEIPPWVEQPLPLEQELTIERAPLSRSPEQCPRNLAVQLGVKGDTCLWLNRPDAGTEEARAI